MCVCHYVQAFVACARPCACACKCARVRVACVRACVRVYARVCVCGVGYDTTFGFVVLRFFISSIRRCGVWVGGCGCVRLCVDSCGFVWVGGGVLRVGVRVGVCVCACFACVCACVRVTIWQEPTRVCVCVCVSVVCVVVTH